MADLLAGRSRPAGGGRVWADDNRTGAYGSARASAQTEARAAAAEAELARLRRELARSPG